MSKTNREGLTWTEWVRAAGRRARNLYTRAAMIKAWEEGEDPTDWRAASQK